MVGKKPNILIIDDVKANSRLLAKRLSDDYECQLAISGEEAFQLLADNLPDLILLDILMPDMDGFEVCRRLKDNEKTRAIPIIFITSLDQEDDEAKGLTLGAVDYIKKPFHMAIVKARIRNHIALKQARDLLEKQAFIDSLTTIPNRRRFDEVLAKEWQRACKKQKPISMILMDIDYFKNYNDNYGHQQGDECLIQIGYILKRMLQKKDELVARYGGEEFTMILPNISEEDAFERAEMIRRAVLMQHIPHRYSGISEFITVSLGVAQFNPSAEDHSEILLSMADNALYRAKEQGRNQVSY